MRELIEIGDIFSTIYIFKDKIIGFREAINHKFYYIDVVGVMGYVTISKEQFKKCFGTMLTQKK